VPSLADAFRVLNELEAEGIVERYAVGGAMAMVFWAEPTVTFDLDIFALLPESETGSPIISLEPLYSVLRKRGFEVAAEHVMIHGTPVQFLVSPNELSDEAIQTAVAQELDGVPFASCAPNTSARFGFRWGERSDGSGWRSCGSRERSTTRRFKRCSASMESAGDAH